MKLSVALFFAGLSGALGTLCVLLSFGTDYWLLAWESCGPAAEVSFSAAYLLTRTHTHTHTHTHVHTHTYCVCVRVSVTY